MWRVAPNGSRSPKWPLHRSTIHFNNSSATRGQRVLLLGARSPGGAILAAQPRVADEALQACSYFRRLVRLCQKASNAVLNDFGDTASAYADNRQRSGHCLNDDAAEGLIVRGVYEDVNFCHDARPIGDKTRPDEPIDNS